MNNQDEQYILQQVENFPSILLEKVFYNDNFPENKVIAISPTNNKEYYVVGNKYKWMVLNEKTFYNYIMDDLQYKIREILDKHKRHILRQHAEIIVNTAEGIFLSDNNICSKVMSDLKKVIIKHSPIIKVNMDEINEFIREEERVSSIKKQLEQLKKNRLLPKE